MSTKGSGMYLRRLDQVLREYNPGKENLQRLRLRHRTDRAIAKALEMHMPHAQHSALMQRQKFKLPIH